MYKRPFHSEDLSSYRFLITGGAGFIGSHLVEYLLKYNAGRVIVLDNLATGRMENLDPWLDDPRLELVLGDIRDRELTDELVRQADFVSHQAALGSVPRSIEDPLTTNDVNITGFLTVLDAVRRSPRTKRMVYAASSSTYGDSTELPKREERIGNPLSPYAVTKWVNELYARVFGDLYGTDTVGLRYFNIFGPRQDPEGPYAAVIPLFMKAVIRGESPRINGDGQQTRDFTFVENAVQANIKAFFAGPQAKNQVFNVAVGRRVSLLELLDAIAGIAGREVKPVFGPPRPGDVRDSLAHIGKAEELLGYNRPVTLEEGLPVTYAYFQKFYA